MSQPEVYVCPLPPEPPSHLPPHPAPLGCHRALGLSSLHHIANSHQLSILHMELYMFQSYSIWPTLSFTVFISLFLYLHYCPANRFISTIFLDSIYVCVCVCVSKIHFNRLHCHGSFEERIIKGKKYPLIKHVNSHLFPSGTRWTQPFFLERPPPLPP